MLAARINQRGDILAAQNIKAPADQRKTFVREILHRGNKSELAIEPRLDGVLVGGSNVHKMAGLQRANMGVDHFGGREGRRVRLVLDARPSKPGNRSNDQNSRGSRKPSPSGNAEATG